MSPHRLGSVLRQRLLALIDEPALAPITLITAPAGYGKTTLAQQWIAQHPCHVSGWYQVRTEHNLLETFLSQLWSTIDSATGQSDPVPEAMSASSLRDRLQRAPAPILLVIDDYHLIENESIDQVMGTLLRDLPDGVHCFILSRHLPALSLARMRAYGKVRSIGQDQLSFTLDEVRDVFAGIALSDELLRQLTERSEGWIAGLQLAMMSANASGDLTLAQFERILDALSENRLLNDYIMEEVLETLPDDLRTFVFDTVYLDSLDPALCDAVLGIDSSQAFLDRLEDAIVFVGRPDGEGDPLTYHRLFAECVQRLRQRSVAEPTGHDLWLRASRWYRAQGKLGEATQYALYASAWDEAAELISEFVVESWTHVNVWDSYFWLGRLPQETLRKEPRLLQSYVEATISIGQIDETRPLVDGFLTAPGFEPTAGQRGWHAKMRAVTAYLDGDHDEAMYQGYRALSLLPLDDTIGRLLVWALIHVEAYHRGEDELSLAAYEQAAFINELQQRESVHWHFVVGLDRVNHLAIRGDLFGANALIHRQIDEMPVHFRNSLGHHELRLMTIALAQNRLDAVASYIGSITADLQRRGYALWFAEFHAAAAEYFIATGDPERARWTLEHALSVTRDHGGREFIQKIETGLANCWLHTGQNALVRHWAATLELTPYLGSRFGDIEPRLVLATLMLRQQRSEEARALLNESIALARRRKHRASEIGFLTLAFVAAQRLGSSEDAHDCLRQALELGAPGQFTRVFTHGAFDLQDALRAVIPSLSEQARVHANALVGGAGLPAPVGGALAVSGVDLTPRECEVLAELVQDKSNREIGESLYISERTVKKHLASLFRKTNSSSRIGVALWAQEHMPETIR